MVFGLFKKRRQREAKFMRDSVDAVQYRDNMDRIIETHSLRPETNGESSAAEEAVLVSTFITKEAVCRAGRVIGQLTRAETFSTVIVSIVVSNHITRMAEVPFALVSNAVGSCILLDSASSEEKVLMATNPEKFWEALGSQRLECIEEYNRLRKDATGSELINTLGQLVARFFSSNESKYLDNLGEITAWLLDAMKEQDDNAHKS